MRNLLLAGAAALALSACATSGLPGDEASVLPYVAKVVVGEASEGSGVVVRVEGTESFILTCDHVLTADFKQAAPTTVKVNYQGTDYVGHLVKDDAKRDLALIEVGTAFKAAPMSSTVPTAGTPEIIAGYPYGHGPLISQGFTSSATETVLNHPDDVGSATSMPGYSGSGMFVYEGGEWKLAGILEGGLSNKAMMISTPIAGVSFTIQLSAVKEFLNGAA